MWKNVFVLVVICKLCDCKYTVQSDDQDIMQELDIILNIDDLYNLNVEELALLARWFNLIFPGTKWCGPGDIAKDIDDIGESWGADMCCRDHDLCDYLLAGNTRFNLTNTNIFTSVNCNCDETFRKCLHDANTMAASAIGVVYFDILDTKCYKNEYPITGCKKEGGWLMMKCVEYSFDTNATKLYQWFDVPSF